MKDPTPTEVIEMCFTDGTRYTATAQDAFAAGDLARSLEHAIALRQDAVRAETELRGLAGIAQPPTASMSTVQARQLARHVKAALLHLRAAEQIAEDADVDMVPDPYDNATARLLLAASAAVEDADTWAINNAAANGCGKETWAAGRWCSQPDGALPQV